jgi:DNA topoisomerase-1
VSLVAFEIQLMVQKHIDQIRKDYTTELTSKIMADRQRATAMYFIDRLALRAGNEKGDDEADTYGCCSLQFEHVTLEPPNIVKFDFLGKDSMRFQQEVPVEPQVFKNIKLFKKEPKTVGDDLFDRLNVSFLMFVEGQKLIADWSTQQTSWITHAWFIRKGVPYIQRLVDFPGAIEEYT